MTTETKHQEQKHQFKVNRMTSFTVDFITKQENFFHFYENEGVHFYGKYIHWEYKS